MKVLKFYRFGSPDSTDADILYIVDKIPKRHICSELSHIQLHPLEYLVTEGKEPNRNFAVVKNNIVVDVYKGAPDEVNNSIIYTYSYHNQLYPLTLMRVERDVIIKCIRSVRTILSLNTRTRFRTVIKEALRSGSMRRRLEAIKLLDFKPPFNKKDVDITVAKKIAFQIGQTLALLQGKEIYTKEQIVKLYPDLHNCIYRVKVDSEVLKEYASKLVDMIKSINYKENGTYITYNGKTYDVLHEKIIK